MLPRLTKFVAENDTSGMTRLYRDATQMACVIAAPVVALLAFFAYPVLTAWTGKLRTRPRGGPDPPSLCHRQWPGLAHVLSLLPAIRQGQSAAAPHRQCHPAFISGPADFLHRGTLWTRRHRCGLGLVQWPVFPDLCTDRPCAVFSRQSLEMGFSGHIADRRSRGGCRMVADFHPVLAEWPLDDVHAGRCCGPFVADDSEPVLKYDPRPAVRFPEIANRYSARGQERSNPRLQERPVLRLTRT